MKDLTQGSVLSHLLGMAAPAFAGVVTVMLCQLVDMYFVAGLGETAVAAVGAAGVAGFLTAAVSQALGVGAVALVAQAAGRRDFKAADDAFNQALGLSVVCAVVAVAAGIGLASPYMRAVASEPATIAAGATYLRWFIPALALQFVTQTMGSGLRGLGVVTPPMAIQTLTVVLNIALAPVLVAGYGTGLPLGVAGAGLASSLAVALAVAALSAYVARARSVIRIDGRALRPRLALWRRIAAIGLPAGGELAILFVQMSAIYFALAGLGAAAQAGFGVGTRVLGLMQTPAIALAFSAAPIIGQSFGAGCGARVREAFRTTLLATGAVAGASTLVATLAARPLVAPFATDLATLAVGAEFLRMVSINLVAQSVVFVCGALFQGLGHTTPQLFGSALRCVTYVGPVLWLAARPGFAATDIWIASIATTTLQAAATYLLARRELARRLTAQLVVRP